MCLAQTNDDALRGWWAAEADSADAGTRAARCSCVDSATAHCDRPSSPPAFSSPCYAP